MRFGFLNNFTTQLAAPVSDTATEIEISSAADKIAEALTNAGAVALTLFVVDAQGNETKREVVYVTALDELMMTVERGKEGSTPTEFSPGDGVEARLTAGMLSNFAQGLSGSMPNYYQGNVALGIEHEQNGESLPNANAVADGAIAYGAGSSSTGNSAVALGGGLNSELAWGGEIVLVSGSQANGAGAVAIGAGSQANSALAVAIGAGSSGIGLRSVALAGGQTYGEGSAAIGALSQGQGDYSLALGGSAYGDSSVAIGDGSVVYGEMSVTIFGNASGNHAVSIGSESNAPGNESVAIGVSSRASTSQALALGYGAVVNVPGGTAVGRNTNVSSPKSSAFGDGAKAQPPGATALGTESEGLAPEVVAAGMAAKAMAPYSIALGSHCAANIPGGLATTAISYLPMSYNQTGEYGGPPPTASRQAAMQVIVATEPLDLTDDTAYQTITMPTYSKLFINAFDVVLIAADGAGGTPEIQIGPDDAGPADYLAATAITKTASGGRETFQPLVDDGVTTLRVSVLTPGSGTLFYAKVVARGYVVEI